MVIWMIGRDVGFEGLSDAGFIGAGKGHVPFLIGATHALLLCRVASMVGIDAHWRRVIISRISSASVAHTSCSPKTLL